MKQPETAMKRIRGEGSDPASVTVGSVVAAQDVGRKKQEMVVVDPRHETRLVHLHHL